jgi:hypothetical protein
MKSKGLKELYLKRAQDLFEQGDREAEEFVKTVPAGGNPEVAKVIQSLVKMTYRKGYDAGVLNTMEVLEKTVREEKEQQEREAKTAN